PGDQFTFEQSAPGGPKGDRELGASEMLLIVDSLDNIQKELSGNFDKVVNSFMIKKSPDTHNGEKISKEFLIYRVAEKIRNQQSLIMSNLDRIQSNIQESNSYWVEINKKYSLPVACIIFIFIGAPLGIMTRKGGFGIAAGISLFFFLIYWAFLIGGEKLADRGLFSPFWGMWSANIIMGIFGIILTVKSAKEAIFLNFDFFKKLIPKSWRAEEPVNENN
ncbi:MAG: LptF/LptG family permease, partial [Ignavibacteriaceae bacterium]|nr:LptF/LptG family permease [Ignavibacteriaceae bacterium]